MHLVSFWMLLLAFRCLCRCIKTSKNCSFGKCCYQETLFNFMDFHNEMSGCTIVLEMVPIIFV